MHQTGNSMNSVLFPELLRICQSHIEEPSNRQNRDATTLRISRDLKNALTEENNAHFICRCASFIVTLHKNSKIVQ